MEDFEASSVPGTITYGFCCENFVVLNSKKINSFNKNSKPSQLGVYIYAHARRHMYEQVYRFVDCIYGDTDSVFFDRS